MAGGGRQKAGGASSHAPTICKDTFCILVPAVARVFRTAKFVCLAWAWQFLQRWAGQKELVGVAVRSTVRMRGRPPGIIELKSDPARDLPLAGRDLVASSLLR